MSCLHIAIVLCTALLNNVNMLSNRRSVDHSDMKRCELSNFSLFLCGGVTQFYLIIYFLKNKTQTPMPTALHFAPRLHVFLCSNDSSKGKEKRPLVVLFLYLADWFLYTSSALNSWHHGILHESFHEAGRSVLLISTVAKKCLCFKLSCVKYGRSYTIIFKIQSVD